MFDIGWGELLLIGIVALVAIGPKELPTVMRTVGQWTAKLRRMAAEFQSQFHEAMREAELADIKKQVDEMTSEVRSYGTFDPVSEVRRELEKTQFQIENAIAEKPAAEQAAPAVADDVAPAAESASGAAPVSSTPSAAPSVAPAVPTAGLTPSGENGSGASAPEGKAT
ncbi:MAG TPA: Sec-independent protein translocase protein TatB [Xanthobacteraceae bacterium]|jgi:sec-independent protein translocase protein TatB